MGSKNQFALQVLLKDAPVSQSGNTTVSITCASAWEDNLYAGSSEGEILHFFLDRQGATENIAPGYILASRQQVAKRAPVTSILLLPQIFRAIVLCNSELKFYTLPEFTPASKLRIRDANNCCEDLYREGTTEDGSVLVTVLTRTMILRIKVEREAKRMKAFDYPNALVVCQRGPIACVANAEKYDLMDLEKGERIPLFPIVQNAEVSQDTPSIEPTLPPLIVSVGEEDFLVTTGTTINDPAIGLFVDLNGDPVRGTLMFSSYPRAMTINYPHVFAMMQNLDVEIHSVESQQVLQIISSPFLSGSATITRVPDGSKFCLQTLAEKLLMVPFDSPQNISTNRRDEEVQIARRLAMVSSRIYIASSSTLSSVITLPWLLQADALLDSNKVEEALALANQASQAMDMNFDAERLFHEMAYINQKAGFVLLRETLFEDAFQYLEKANTDPRLIIQLFPPFTTVDISSIYLYSGVRDVLSSLNTIETTAKCDGIVVNKLSRNYDPFIRPSSADAEATLELKRILLQNSRDVLLNYLFRFREKKGYASIGEDAQKIFECVDLVLLTLILEMSKDEGRQRLYDLIDSVVDCFEEAEKLLIEKERYYVLSRLYQSRGMAEKVLETWGKMIEGTWPDEEFKNGDDRMKDYLMKCRDADLVFKFAMWLTRRNPEAGVQVLAGDAKRRSRIFTTEEIIARLREESPVGLKLYLEHLIFERNDSRIFLHQELLLLYINDVLSAMDNLAIRESVETSISSFRDHAEPKPAYTEYILRRRPLDDESEETTKFWKVRLKLVELLQSGLNYDAPQALERIGQREELLLAELVILYGRLLRHDEALRLLVHDLKDFQGAETYCYSGGTFIESTKSKIDHAALQRELFRRLLGEYLRLESTSDRVTQTVNLLDRWGRFFDIKTVLDVVPDEWSVAILQKFLIAALRRTLHEKRQVKLIKSLCLGQNIAVNAEWLELVTKKKPFVQTEEVVAVPEHGSA